MRKFILLLLIGSILYSCKTQDLYLSVLEPAPVTLPNYIKKPGVINRTQVSESTKNMDKVDKVLSLEGAELDKEGASACIAGLSNELLKNKRFNEIVNVSAPGLSTTGSGIFPAPLGWEEVDRLCKQSGTDALFSLEMFDTDTKIDYSQTKKEVKSPLGIVPLIEHHARMQTLVKTGWRIYDPKNRVIVDEIPMSDEITFSGDGINPVAAAKALMGRKDAVKQVSEQVGQAYAMRIIPYWIRVSREYYVKGTDNFKIAKRKARTGNWDEASRHWEKELNNSKAKIAGRACYNMAIINEINGNLDEAVKWAQKSYEDYNNKRALNYVRILENRKAANRVLDRQNTE
ncbi:MAG: DUF6340 family protein [Bacteroidales bacterium]